MTNLKNETYQLCLQFIEQRIDTAQTALKQAQEASNDDTKSSAGDKFETTREMMQQDIARNKNLLFDGQQNLQLLQSLENMAPADNIRNGALVKTDNGMFYIAISAGMLQLPTATVFAISIVSPIGQLLKGKIVGDVITFNKKEYKILEIS